MFSTGSSKKDRSGGNPRLFNVAEYHRLVDIDIFDPDEQIELIEGRIFQMHPSELKRFTADEYKQLQIAGIIREDEHLELVEGVILTMRPKSPRHSNTVRRVDACFRRLIGNRALVMTQDAVHLNEYTELEPDLAVIVQPLSKYDRKHPEPEDIILVVEVAETSLEYDRNHKARIYAQAGIAQYVIVNAITRQVEEYQNPGPSGYQTKQTYDIDASFDLPAFPDTTVYVRELFE